jgi:hypothetical protein
MEPTRLLPSMPQRMGSLPSKSTLPGANASLGLLLAGVPEGSPDRASGFRLYDLGR